MIKLVSIIKRRAALQPEAFQDYWRTTHADLVRKLPGLRRYVQCHTLLGGYRKGEPAADGVAELWFDNSDALRVLHGSAALQKVEDDQQAFIEPGEHRQLFVMEHVIKDGPAHAEGVKNIELVKRKPDMAINDFQHHWRVVHGPLGAAIPTVSRYVQNHTTRAAYERHEPPPLDGLALTWFRDIDAMRESARTHEYAATRADESNFVTEPLDFIITREHVIV